MTAAQVLVALSGLSGVSAAQHLLGVTAGSGPGTTVFASRFSVLVDEPSVSLFEKGENVLSVPKPSAEKRLADSKRTDVEVRQEQVAVFKVCNEVWVTTRSMSQALHSVLPSAVVRRSKTSSN